MLDGIKKIWREVRRMFGYTTLKNIVGKDITFSEEMIDKINEWKQILSGQAEWTSEYIESLGIEQGICREFVDTVLNEMETSISIERLDKIYQKCITGINRELQNGLALGSLIIKPIGADKIEYITPDKFIPISFDDDGKPSDVGFLTVKKVGESDYFIRFERHYFIDGNLTIENKCYHSRSRSDLGIPCDLKEVGEWSRIEPGPVTYPGMKQMDFGYYKNPIHNDVDGSACGISIFDAAIGRIKKADIQAARLDWEFESGERVIHVDNRALNADRRSGRLGMARLNKRLYRGLNLEDGKDKELLREYSPEMRDEAYRRGLEEYKREIEFIVGLAYGDLSDVQQVEKTAEEVKVSKTRKYNRVTAIQNNLKSCLEDFVSGLAFYNGLYTSGYEFSCKFNDSILTNEETERQQDRLDVSMGVMSKTEYRAKWYGESMEDAEKNIAGLQQNFPDNE